MASLSMEDCKKELKLAEYYSSIILGTSFCIPSDTKHNELTR